jgi:hypothetical protein
MIKAIKSVKRKLFDSPPGPPKDEKKVLHDEKMEGLPDALSKMGLFPAPTSRGNANAEAATTEERSKSSTGPTE